jgi:hypothetical protein
MTSVVWSHWLHQGIRKGFLEKVNFPAEAQDENSRCESNRRGFQVKRTVSLGKLFRVSMEQALQRTGGASVLHQGFKKGFKKPLNLAVIKTYLFPSYQKSIMQESLFQPPAGVAAAPGWSCHLRTQPICSKKTLRTSLLGWWERYTLDLPLAKEKFPGWQCPQV